MTAPLYPTQTPITGTEFLIYTQEVKVKVLAKTLQHMYPKIYPKNKPKLYINISKTLLKVIDVYNTNGTISKKVLRSIKTLQEAEPLFIKDKTRNYSNSPKCKKAQGYNTTAHMERVIALAMYYITLAPQPTIRPLQLSTLSTQSTQPIRRFYVRCRAIIHNTERRPFKLGR